MTFRFIFDFYSDSKDPDSRMISEPKVDDSPFLIELNFIINVSSYVTRIEYIPEPRNSSENLGNLSCFLICGWQKRTKAKGDEEVE